MNGCYSSYRIPDVGRYPEDYRRAPPSVTGYYPNPFDNQDAHRTDYNGKDLGRSNGGEFTMGYSPTGNYRGRPPSPVQRVGGWREGWEQGWGGLNQRQLRMEG